MSKDIEERLRSKLVELVEEYFPKGDKGRGKAAVMMSRFFVEMLKALDIEP